MAKEENNEEEKHYPAEEQGIEKEKTDDEKSLEMETGEKEEDVYDDAGRDKLMEDDEITPEEDAFLEGYEDKGHLAKCEECGKLLEDVDNKEGIVEREFDGELRRFCSEECAEKYAKKEREV